MRTVADVADAFLRWFDRFSARDQVDVGIVIAGWAEQHAAPELLTAIRRVRPELVEGVGTSADVTRVPWVRELSELFVTFDVWRWPTAWRAQLRAEKPYLAGRLKRAEVVIDRHVTNLERGDGYPAIWPRACWIYEDVLSDIAVWLDQRARCS